MNSAPCCGSGSPVRSVTLKQSVPLLFLTGLVMCCALLAGCQKNLIQTLPEAKLPLPVAEKESEPEVPEELQGLQVYLSKDLWSRNDHWSALEEWKTLQEHKQTKRIAPPNVHRWLFGSAEPERLLTNTEKIKPAVESAPQTEAKNKAQTNDSEQPAVEVAESGEPQPTEPASAETPTPKSENWSIQPLHAFFIRPAHDTSLPQELQKDPLAGLKQLASQDSLAGWNAAILWATLEPASASQTISTLEKIAFDIPETEKTRKNKTEPPPIELFSLQDLQKQEAAKAKTESKPRTVSAKMKLAAINALSLVLSESDAIPLKTKNRLTDTLQRPDISMETRNELYCGLARFIPPVNIPTLELSLEMGDENQRLPKTLRRSAMNACLVHALWFYADLDQFSTLPTPGSETQQYDSSHWPENMTQVRWDSDAQMRMSFGFWAAVTRHPDREAILFSQLKDADLQVQNKAIEYLAIVGTDTALAELQRLSERPQESTRIAVATGLAPWGAKYLAPLSKDDASAVRLAAAKALGKNPTPEAALLLRTLLDDNSNQVQSEVINSIRQWPDELAIPLLLEGIQEGIYKTRRKCILQLTDRTGMGGSISIEAPRDERIAAVQELVKSQQLPGALWNQLLQTGLRDSGTVNQSRAAEIQAYFQQLINEPRESRTYQLAFQELANLSPDEVKTLEKLILDTAISLPDEIYTSLLPQLDSTYAALNELSSEHIADRRKGAQTLLLKSHNVSLNPVVVRRLRKLMAHEQDRLVWRGVMSSISRDNHDEAAQLALLAINHNWADIRILGCEYLGSFGLPQYAVWLLPLLDDKNESVQLAAINAIGHCHNPIAIHGMNNTNQPGQHSPSLHAKLTHADQRVRFETVAALSRLGHIEGMQELVRLSSDTRNSVRMDAVREMGDSGQTRFVEPLIQMVWTERNPQALKTALESLEKLVPLSEQPPELKTQAQPSARAKIWMNWWQTHHSGTATRLFTGR